MKLKKLILCISFVFIIFLSTTNVYASENVKIKSIDLVDKSENTTETSEATFDGLTMDFNLKFYKTNDYAKYKVVVENNESKDYKILVDSNFGNSKYITYEYEKTENLKANSDTEFLITVKYKNQVDENSFSDGKYTEKNSAVLKLDDGSISNPLTSNNEAMIIIGLIVMSGTLFILFKNKKSRKISVFVLFGLLSLPLFVKAVDYLKITVNSNVEIERGYRVDYEVFDVYIKDTDMEYFDLSHSKSSSIVYEGSVSDENKYMFWRKINFYEDVMIYKGDTYYAPGETVKFDPNSIKIYDFDESKCKSIGYTNGNTGYSIYLCENGPKKVNPNEWTEKGTIYNYDYRASAIKYSGYTYNEDDNIVMQFSNARDRWEDEGYLDINKDCTFKMPNHDVLFTIDYNGIN